MLSAGSDRNTNNSTAQKRRKNRSEDKGEMVRAERPKAELDHTASLQHQTRNTSPPAQEGISSSPTVAMARGRQGLKRGCHKTTFVGCWKPGQSFQQTNPLKKKRRKTKKHMCPPRPPPPPPKAQRSKVEVQPITGSPANEMRLAWSSRPRRSPGPETKA